jgi:hypothetical protein
VIWFDVWLSVDSKDALAVWNLLDMKSDLQQTLDLESLAPTTSPASSEIREKIGSVDAQEFSSYIATKDARLGLLLAKRAISLQKVHAYEKKAVDFAIPFFSQLLVIPLYWIGNPRKRSFAQTRNVWFSMQGAWFLITGVVAALGSLVPMGRSLGSLAFAFGEFALVIATIIYHYRGFHFTHGITRFRFVLCVVLGLVAFGASVWLFLIVLDSSTPRLVRMLSH